MSAPYPACFQWLMKFGEFWYQQKYQQKIGLWRSAHEPSIGQIFCPNLRNDQLVAAVAVRPRPSLTVCSLRRTSALSESARGRYSGTTAFRGLGNVGKSLDPHRLAIRKLGRQHEFTAHLSNVVAQRRQQHVATLLQSRNAVLPDAQALRHPLLRQLTRLAQIAQDFSSAISPAARASTRLRRSGLRSAISSS